MNAALKAILSQTLNLKGWLDPCQSSLGAILLLLRKIVGGWFQKNAYNCLIVVKK